MIKKQKKQNQNQNPNNPNWWKQGFPDKDTCIQLFENEKTINNGNYNIKEN